MPTIVGVGAVASGTGAVTAPYPGGYTAVADDIAVTFCECESAGTITPPSGWGAAATANQTGGTTTKLVALWKRLTAGEASPSIADAGDHLQARMIIVGGVVTSGNPWDITPVASLESVADTTVSIPGGTTINANCLCLVAFGTGQDIASTAGATGWTNASLANLTERMDNWQSASGLGGGYAVATGEKAAAGVVSATTATLSLTANFKALMFIPLRGAAGFAEPPGLLIRSPRPVESPAVAGPYVQTNPSTLIGG